MRDDQASFTAYNVLQGILYVAQQDRYVGLVPEDMEQASRRILESTEEGKKRLAMLRRPGFRAAVPLIEALSLRGFTLHFVLRKRFIQDRVLEAIGGGVTQIVNLGAGFDTLAWRLHRAHPDVTFFEIDHHATSAVKQQVLANDLGFEDNLHLLPVDFAKETFDDALRREYAFRSDRQTLFVCEGVLAYLDAEQVARLFDGVRRLGGQTAPMLLCTFHEPRQSSRNRSGPLLDLYLKIKREPIRFCLPHERAQASLQEYGYTLERIAMCEDFRNDYLAGMDHGRLMTEEYAVLCRAGKNFRVC